MKRKKIHFTIEYIVLALMVFTLALDRRLLPPLLLLLSFNWLVEVFGDVFHKLFLKTQKSMVAFPYKWNNLSKNRLILALGLYSGLFLLYAIGLLYSENMSHGRFDIVSNFPSWPCRLFSLLPIQHSGTNLWLNGYLTCFIGLSHRNSRIACTILIRCIKRITPCRISFIKAFRLSPSILCFHVLYICIEYYVI